MCTLLQYKLLRHTVALVNSIHSPSNEEKKIDENEKEIESILIAMLLCNGHHRNAAYNEQSMRTVFLAFECDDQTRWQIDHR